MPTASSRTPSTSTVQPQPEMLKRSHRRLVGGELLELLRARPVATDRHGRKPCSWWGSGHPPATVDLVDLQWTEQLVAVIVGVITAFAVCAHQRDAGCGCPKPKPRLVLELGEAHSIELAASTMVDAAEYHRRLAVAAGIGRFAGAADYMAT
jgi:hypothetical protein